MRLSECRLNGVFLATVHLSLSFTMLFIMAFMVGQMTVTGFFFHAHHLPTEGRQRQVAGAVSLLCLLSLSPWSPLEDVPA